MVDRRAPGDQSIELAADLPSVSIEGGSAMVLADLVSIRHDLGFVKQLCVELRPMLGAPEPPIACPAFWEAAVIAYGRCFRSGRPHLSSRKGVARTRLDDWIRYLDADDVAAHERMMALRDQHVGHRVSNLEQVAVTLYLNPDPDQRAVVGLGHLLMHHVVPEAQDVGRLEEMVDRLAAGVDENIQVLREEIVQEAGTRLDELYREAGFSSD